MNQNYSLAAESTDYQTLIEKPDFITKITITFTLLFIFLAPFGNGIWDGLPKIFASVAIGFSAILFLLHGTHRNYSFFHFFAILFIAWQVISLMWTNNFEVGQKDTITAVQVISIAFLFTLVINNKKKVLWAYQAYVTGNMVGSSIIISNFIQGIQSPYYNRYGIQNIETDLLSVFLALSLPMSAYLVTQHKSKIFKLINLIAIPLIFYAIFLTGTRTGSIVGILGIIYWIFTYRKSSISIKGSIAIMLVISIIAILTFAPKASIDRIFSSGKSITSGTLNYRSVIWAASLNQWRKTPILGTGIGGLGLVLSREHVNYPNAHNSFIHLLTENGIIGLLLYLAMIISLLYYILRAPMDEKSFMLTLLMVLLVSQLSTQTHTEKTIWIVFSLLAIHSNRFSFED